MPTYAYLCTQCSHAFEIHQAFTEDSLTVCPECEGRLRKQFSSVGVVFKGSGFYRTDARAGSKSSVGSVPSAGSSGSSSSADSSGSSGSSSTGASNAPSATPSAPAPAAAAASSSTS